ncbi:MAG: hypothetical protein DMF56_01420 [Acidobacteria bacterium]|nr:MAG: hypothetical protein DMF56_01420 [Acidobacteriota bacterium]
MCGRARPPAAEEVVSLFVDTSAWYAAADRDDRGHQRAKAILTSNELLVTTDHILIECWMLIRHRIGRSEAIVFWSRLPHVAHIETVLAADLQNALEIVEEWSDQDFSIVDCTSFAVMQRLGLRRAASFDSDFSIFRFGPDRRRAFEVVR